jgi:hypothetical protein
MRTILFLFSPCTRRKITPATHKPDTMHERVMNAFAAVINAQPAVESPFEFEFEFDSDDEHEAAWQMLSLPEVAQTFQRPTSTRVEELAFGVYLKREGERLIWREEVAVYVTD